MSCRTSLRNPENCENSWRRSADRCLISVRRFRPRRPICRSTRLARSGDLYRRFTLTNDIIFPLTWLPLLLLFTRRVTSDWSRPHVVLSCRADGADRCPKQGVEERTQSGQKFRKRMGWRFKWVSSHGTDFNYDFDVSFRKEDIAARRAQYNYRPLDFEIEDLSGFSFFCKNRDGEIFHTYSTFARGDEMLCTAYMYIDLLPKGRNEDDLEDPSSWWRHHDKYTEGTGEKDCDPSVRQNGCCS